MKGGSIKGQCRNPGLAQGFLRFGSVHHQILVFIHEVGRSTPIAIQEGLNLDRHSVGMSLTRLVRYGFLFRVDKAAQVITGEKTASVYDLKSSDQKIRYRPLTNSERSKRVRERKKIKVSSIFTYRGSIPIAQPESMARKSRAL